LQLLLQVLSVSSESLFTVVAIVFAFIIIVVFVAVVVVEYYMASVAISFVLCPSSFLAAC